MKTKIHVFQPGDKDTSAVKLLWSKILALLKTRDFWYGTLAAILILLLFLSPSDVTIPKYKLSDIAQATVRAPRDIQVPDSTTTEHKQKEARDRILPVYDYEPTLVNSSISRMHEVFVFLRNEPRTQNFAQLAESLRTDLNLSLDPSFLAAASRANFDDDLEKKLSQKLQKVMSQYIIPDRNVLFLLANKGITVRNQETGREQTLAVTSVLDVRDIQELLRRELSNDPKLTAREASIYTDFLIRFVAPTIFNNNGETQARVRKAMMNTEPVFYQIKKNRVIVRDGEEITPAILAQLKAIEQTEPSGPPIRYAIGILILLAIFLISFQKYLRSHQYADIKLRDKSLFLLCGIVLVTNLAIVKLGLLIAVSLSSAFASPPMSILFAYQVAIPFAVGALLLTILTDRAIATIYTFGFSLLVGVLTSGDFYLLFYSLAAGIAAAFSITRYYQRSALLRSGLKIWLASLLTVFTIYLIRESGLSWNEMAFLTATTLLSAVLTVAIVSVSSPILEWAFNITTDIKLLELSNLDLPVLRQLALEAPGTYHHSIVMGTIAEAAAVKVGANPLFLRVAALYHDIGKIRKSEYYVENQREANKHDTLNPRMSALVIINHVKEGLEVAKMLRLPSDIVGMIPQHHGTRLITYFYKKAKDMENPEIEVVKEEDYRYPGPKPQSKEGAILMLADATEAASRTLTEPSPARLKNMVDTIFRAIFEDGQLDESNLTMKDLNQIADAFVRKLESVFHHRIAYPGYEFNRDEKAKDSGESQELSEKMAN
ncbi:MAG TPA: HDIG domain-containing protein [Acidobacteriota bacterium]|nr:HDIG domain-containing protein [Acidobacteriota bacterium]